MEIKTVKNEYHGKPFISLFEKVSDEGDIEMYVGKPVISFGVKKAKAILAAIEDIKQFVREAKCKKLTIAEKKLTIAEKIANMIGHDNFLRAEAYYYENTVGVELRLNFVDFINTWGQGFLLSSFTWSETVEGFDYWSALSNTLNRRLG